MRFSTLLIMALIFGCATASTVDAQTFDHIWYVDDSATTGANDGSSWTDAFLNLQLAVAEAEGTVNQTDLIKVGQGTYKADVTSPINDESASVILIESCTIRGGYRGYNTHNLDPETRNVALYQSKVTGDLGNNDHSNTLTDNTDHIVKAQNVDFSAELDGFWIIAGNCTDEEGDDIEVCDSHEIPVSGGAGLHCLDANPTIRNCIFMENKAHSGGAIRLVCSDARIVNCSFIENEAIIESEVNDAGNGGGIASFGANTAEIINCIFDSNTCGHVGGGMSIQIRGETNVTNCLFVDNVAGAQAGDSGGGMRVGNNSGVIVTNCTFVKNCAQVGGGFSSGRIANDGQGPPPRATELRNCILWGNTLTENDCVAAEPEEGDGQQIALVLGSDGQTVIFTNCDVEGGADAVKIDANYDPEDLEWSSTNFDLDPMFEDYNGGDFGLQYSSPCLNNGAEALLPDDIGDVDGDSVTITETIPLDLNSDPRQVNSPDCVDVGAFENQEFPEGSCIGDITGEDDEPDGTVDDYDLDLVLERWCAGGGVADVYPSTCGDSFVDVDDMLEVINNWGACESFAPTGLPEWLQGCVAKCGDDYECLVDCIIEHFEE